MPSDKHMEAARELFRDYLKRIDYDRRACFEHDELIQDMFAAALANAEREGMKRAVRFVLSHHEAGPMPFQPTPVDPDRWWQDMQIAVKVPENLLPRSRAHFEARIARWQDLVLSEAGEKA